jgi:hypothetical protein
MKTDGRSQMVKMLEDAMLFIPCEDCVKQEELWSCVPGSTCDMCKARSLIEKVVQELEG